MNLLLVEDDDSLVECLIFLLRLECQQEATVARTISSGIAALVQKKFDLVMLDYKLGYEFSDSIYEYLRSERPNTKVMMITAYPLNRINFGQVKPDWIFQKPFDQQDIQKMVEIICDLKKNKYY